MSNLKLEINNTIYTLDKSFIFSGGEIQIKLPDAMEYPRTHINIRTSLTSANAIMELILTVDALDRKFPLIDFRLIVNYFPYARQDRACVDGESFALEVMCNIINSLGFVEVIVSDPHSSVLEELLNGVKVRSQIEHFDRVVGEFDINIQDYMLISPDKGAIDKIDKIAKFYNITKFNADKIRCPMSGQITETTIDVDNFGCRDLFVVDDIFDGGRTFIELAKVLRAKNCGRLSLYITHGIFSKGTNEVFEYYDDVYTTNSVYSGNDPRIKFVNI